MRKTLSIFLILVLLLSLAACGSKNPENAPVAETTITPAAPGRC